MIKPKKLRQKVIRRLMKEMRPKGVPMDFGIKEFKRLVRANPNLTKAEKNKAIRIYKDRAYERYEAIRVEYEKLYLLDDEGVDKKEEV